ncbi:MAG TPA: DUF192 domain-containing protein, partial [Methanocella sp.]|nr:DUF192 domain-containing protein [Methanocella sp.]
DAGNLLIVDAGNRRAQEVTATGSPLRVDLAPDAYIDTSADVPTFPTGNGYIARWSPATDGSDNLALLSEHGCLLVRDLVPFTLGEPVAVVAEARAVVDRSAPAISITTPADGARYTINQKVSAQWNVSDDLSGLSVATGTVASGSPIDTSLPGPHVFTVEATDNAGNHRTHSCQYYVYDTSPAGGSITGPTQSPGPTPKPGTTPTPRPPTPTPPPAGPTGAVVMLNGGTRISCELATTDDQINRGLMYRPSLASGTGMLFVFTNEQVHTFTMANMNFPLDIIFIKGDMTILNIARNAQPGTTGISSGGSCQYVLEVNAGVAGSVGPGNVVQITWV